MRQTINLNGFWKFIIDQDPQYHLDCDYSRNISLRHWETVPVPGCWNQYNSRYDLYEGVAWFVREFDVLYLPENPVVSLQFGGVNYIADIYMNGQKLGSHEGGYTAFAVDASKAVKMGRNRLAVRVDNRHLNIRLPAVIGWYNYGGIHRDVSLVVSSELQLTGIRIESCPEGEGASGTIHIASSGSDQPVEIQANIIGPFGDEVWEGVFTGSGEWHIPFKIDKACLWSPEYPDMYDCNIEARSGIAVLDEASVEFGIRKIEVSGQKILHNNTPIRLNGMCYLYDHPSTGVAFDFEILSRDLDDLAALGVNCLRSHFPVPDWVMEECDRRGMMLWLEVPIYCVAPPSDASGSIFAEGSVQALALQMLREMVESAVNHPSVVLWSVGNECNTDHPEALAFFRACVEEVRRLDSSRLISYASLYGEVGCAADLVDVMSINEYWGWYDVIDFDGSSGKVHKTILPIDLPELEKCLGEKSKIGKPVLLTEFGADAVPGFVSGSCELWSENYQAELLSRQIEIARSFPAVCGTFPFLYTDYRDPSKPVNDYWHGINLKGLVDYSRNHKLAWKSVKRAYSND